MDADHCAVIHIPLPPILATVGSPDGGANITVLELELLPNVKRLHAFAEFA